MNEFGVAYRRVLSDEEAADLVFGLPREHCIDVAKRTLEIGFPSDGHGQNPVAAMNALKLTGMLIFRMMKSEAV